MSRTDLEGVGIIRESDTNQPQQFGDGLMPWDWGINRFGRRPYRFRLEVHLPGHEPYMVEGKYKVPRKAENTGFFKRAIKLQPGVELPVRVSSTALDDLKIDWDRFLGSGDQKAAVDAASLSAQRAQLKKQIERNPKMQAKMWAGNKMAARAWAEALRGGAMTREEFDRTVDGEVESGRMDPADAEAARASLD